jgi:hypothetical protein
MTAGPVSAATSSSSGEAGGESCSSRGTSVLILGNEENRAEGGSRGRSGSAERDRDGGLCSDPPDESDKWEPGPRIVGMFGIGGTIISTCRGCDDTERPEGDRGMVEPCVAIIGSE